MLKLRSLVAGAFAAGLLLAGPFVPGAVPAALAQDEPQMPNENWSFNNLFGTYDLAAAQRGFSIYQQVCSNCHSMQLLHYRDLSGIGLNAGADQGDRGDGDGAAGRGRPGQSEGGAGDPGQISSSRRSPIEKAARAANNGALPPDLSLIVNAREGHANYVYGILTGFPKPPAGFKMQDGMNYNKMFPGHQIGMPQPLQDGTVDYIDGTPNNLEPGST